MRLLRKSRSLSFGRKIEWRTFFLYRECEGFSCGSSLTGSVLDVDSGNRTSGKGAKGTIGTLGCIRNGSARKGHVTESTL